MARVLPLRGLRYNPSLAPDLGAVLSPPYDVIADAQRQALYARDAHNIVRIESGVVRPGYVPGNDRYTRAADNLRAWSAEGVLVRDAAPALYLTEHDFTGHDGARRTRAGLLARVPARPWAGAEVVPHERTLRAPKADRLELLRTARVQSSPVWAMWTGDAGASAALADISRARPPSAAGALDGEMGAEEVRLWVVDAATDAAHAVLEALSDARLYIADGHHRYETAVAYAAERRAQDTGAPPDADFETVLVYLCAATDPALEILPTHRLVRHAGGGAVTAAAIAERLPAGFAVEERPSLAAALDGAAGRRHAEHAFALALPAGAALIHAPRRAPARARDGLDVVVLDELLMPRLCGIGIDDIHAGALEYSRDAGEVEAAVRRGEFALGACLNPCTTADLVAVADAGETMPQKSTYFHPKVPAGIVLLPV